MCPSTVLPPEVSTLIRSLPGRVGSTRAIAPLGWDRFDVARWVRDGHLDRLMPAWVRLAGDDAAWQDGHLAVRYLLHHRPDAPVRLSGRYGLRARGVDLPPCAPLALVEDNRHLRVRKPRFGVAQRSSVADMPCDRVHSLPLAPLPVLLADAVVEQGEDGADRHALLYRALHRLQPDRRALATAWGGMNHPGASWLLEQVATGAVEHDSPAELNLFDGLFRTYPPPPDCQVWLTPHIRVDFVYLFAGLVIEYMGEDAHAGTVDKDSTRIYALRRLGYDVFVITRSMMRDLPGLAAHIHETRTRRETLVLRGELPRPYVPRQPDRLSPLRTLVPAG